MVFVSSVLIVYDKTKLKTATTMITTIIATTATMGRRKKRYPVIRKKAS